MYIALENEENGFISLVAYVLWDILEKSLVLKYEGMQFKVNIHCTIEYEVTTVKVYLVNSLPNQYF